VSVAVAVWLAAEASAHAAVPVLMAGTAGSAGTLASLAWPVALGPALVSTGGAYAVLLAVDEPPLDTRAAAVAVALLVTGELVGWARELGATTRDEPGNAWRRPIWIAWLAAAALGLTWALLAVVDVARVEGLVVEAVGAVSALAALVLVVYAARARS
jgi:hypothetical protein